MESSPGLNAKPRTSALAALNLFGVAGLAHQILTNSSAKEGFLVVRELRSENELSRESGSSDSKRTKERVR